MKRAAFLDRDGVINRKPPEGQYVTRWEEMQILPGVAEAIASLSGAGFCAIVVSNQRCVAKGLLTILELDSIHQRLCQKLAKAGAEITEVYYCPHDEHPPCGCRKPAPGMLLGAARAHDGQGQLRLLPEVWQADCELHQWICRELNGGSLSGGGAGSPVDSF